MSAPRNSRCMYWQLLVVMLAGCSNGSGSLEEQQQAPPASGAQAPVTIGGSVTGLVGGSVVLQNNGGGTVAITGDGAFAFAETVASGAGYDVVVLTNPTSPPQTCTVANGKGTAGTSNVTNIAVTCTVAPRYTVGVTVTGLTGSGLVLQNNARDDLSINANGNYVFNTAVADATNYTVTVLTQPNGQSCAPQNNTGTIAGANVTNVEVRCAANQFTVSGTVTGLAGTGLVLQLNGGNEVTVAKGATTFAFPTFLAANAPYDVTVKSGTLVKDLSQECVVTDGKGTITNVSVDKVKVTCTTKQFKVVGTVSDLAPGNELGLTLNRSSNVKVLANGSFTFAQNVASGSPFEISVTNPTKIAQECTPNPLSGTVVDADITVLVTCATKTFKVRGTIIGLLGSGLQLSINGSEALTVTGSAFEFGPRIASGAAYQVTVVKEPSAPTQACSLANASGTMGNSDVTNVVVNCSTASFKVGGVVTNLLGRGLVLGNADDRVTVSGAEFTMPTAVPSGATYNITVIEQPTRPKQICTVVPGTESGTVGGEPVRTVSVDCVTQGFIISGLVTGLRASGLVLQNNGGDNLEIAANGRFQFATPVLPGASYSVTVLTHPATPTDPFHLCVPSFNVGIVGNADVEDVLVNCF
jgi:hypothetical protein